MNLLVSGEWKTLGMKILNKIISANSGNSASQFWDNLSPVAGTQWYEVTDIHERWNGLISGDPQLDSIRWVAEKYFPERSPESMLRLACGSGEWELEWASVVHPVRLTGYDISSERIKQARELSRDARGVGGTHFCFDVADLNHLDLGNERFDLVVAKAGLHHLDNLEYVLEEISNHISAGGVFVVDEFVGANRFQWPDRQLEVINGLVSVLPNHIRRSLLNPGEEKALLTRQPVEHMIRVDPSEAARSSEIPSLLAQHFEILEWRPYGGGVLHLLLSEIAGNFDRNRTEDQQLLDLLFGMEDYFMATGEIPSDFLFVVCRPKS